MSRLNDEDQHSFGKATAVLTGIVGAAAFHSLGGAKAIAKGVPKITRFASKLMDDMAEMKLKDFDAEGIGRFYKKHIADDNSTWKSLKNLSDEKIKLEVTGQKPVAAILNMLEIQANSKDAMRKIFNANYADEIVGKLDKKYKILNDEFKDKLDDLTRHVIEKDDLTLFTDEDGVVTKNSDLIKEFIDPDKFQLGEQEDDFFKDLIGTIENKENAFKEFVDAHTNEDGTLDFVNNIKEQLTGKSFAEAFKVSGDESLIDNTIKQGRGLTFGDYVDNLDKFDDQIINLGGDNYISLKDEIKKFVEENEEIRDILIDAKNLKIDKSGDIIDFQEVDNLRKGFLEKLAGTLPGKLAKVTDFLSLEEAGAINFFQKGKVNPLANNDGTNKGKDNIIQILNKYYKIDKNNNLSHMSELDEMYSRSNKHGTVPRMFGKMFGTESEYEAVNKFTKKLDIGTTTERTILDDLSKEGGIIGKYARSVTGVERYNVIDKMLDASIAESDAIAYRKNLKNVNQIFSHIAKAPNMKTLAKMENVVTNDMSRDILQALMTNDQEEMVSTLSKYSKQLRNKDLKSLIKTGASNRENAARMLSIKSDRITDAKNIMKYKDMVKREAFKEVLIAETINEVSGSVNHNSMLIKLRQAGISGSSYENAKNLGHWATLQMKGKLFNNDAKEKGLEAIKEANNDVLELLTAIRKKDTIPVNAEYIKDFRSTVDKIKENYNELTTRTTERNIKAKKIRAQATNDMMMMRKAYTPSNYAKDMIKDMNDATKMKAHTKKFGMQFIAGKDNPEYVTSYTMLPYFFTQRLTEPFANFGLSFSSKNMKSTPDMWKTIMMKRVLPAAAGITAFNYLNYEAKNLTGTSITGAMAQGIANVDLGLRKIADITGAGKLLEAERKLNPITQYWLGEDYQNSAERKDYYENGYDAVRKGRWWAFGSASEFRGSKIAYYQPNFVKRANSDWKDIGIYGSSKEKWKHSWIPTPRHPFAPIRRALDPYWLERKNYNDRPYLETAPLFSTGTPWGAVLNPTVGQIVKPIRKMHRNETRRGLVDPRTLIQERNERLKAKAQDKQHGNLIQISKDGISNVSYTPSALADPNKAMITLRAGNGRVQSIDYNGLDYPEGVEHISEGEISVENSAGNNGAFYIGRNASAEPETGLIEAFETTKLGSMISNGVRKFISPVETLRATNEEIKSKAAASDGTVIKQANLAKMPFRQATQRMTTKQEEADLLLTTSKHDFINDTLFSAKQLSGIYGFLGGLIYSDDKKKVRPESAEKMSSFKRSFWDANIGGLGGGIMEISRRFFPHDDHSWTDINPIRNTMPEWMPTRFQTGDPYTKVPKGEMRLPGKGYESIHKLRPDEYGRYGALDRMRILGDIAPWSEEYKLWRDIASKTVTDEKGKKEIQDIKKRVEKQSRSHEFYNYKFLGNSTEIDTETIESVEGTKITTTSGKQYNMAGVKLGKNADISLHLADGMRIQVEHLKKDKGANGSISAAIYVNGENINQKLVNSGEAKSDTSTAMGAIALTGQFSQFYGAAMEAIAHAPIPFVHNKLMKIDTPLESYKNERVYGTPYSTWDHPIKGFIMPSFQKDWARGPVGQGIALGAWVLAEQTWKNAGKTSEALKKVGINLSETGVNRLASTIFNVANPGAFAGSMMAAIPTGLMGNSEGIKGLFSSAIFGAGVKPGVGRNGARLGATAMIAGYGLTRSDKPIESTAIFTLAGMALSKQLNHKAFNTKQGAIAGATTGLLISAIRNPRFNKDKMFGKYTPESTKKRWDIDEYYDRLEYIKYQGLYEKAARKARIWEGTNIKKIVNANEYQRKINKKKIEKLNNRLDKVSNSKLEDNRKAEIIQKINQQKYKLSTSEQTFRAGKYTKAAIAYKQAAESTIYGLKEDATSQQVLRAIPKGDKDFFMEFAKEKNKKKQDEILKYVSPYQRRALQIAWGRKKIDKVEDNNDYFKDHFMPGVFWAGWSPQVDMEHVKMKTIENEGMLLSDFGIYESQSKEPSAIMAPTVGRFDSANTSGLGLQARLQSALNGAGLIGVKVSVSPTSANGIEVMANITNAAKITEYKVREGINKVVGTRLFY